MPWTLTIKHIRLHGKGDSTLIVAKNGAATRTVLIDGGMFNDRNLVEAEMAGLAKLDVMVATHYDQDHYAGLTALLASRAARYAGVRLYDQGESGTITAIGRAIPIDEDALNDGRRVRRNVGYVASEPNGREDGFSRYIARARECGAVRLTENVLSRQGVPAGLDDYFPPYKLVGREIMWDNAANLSAASTAAIPAGAPQLICIAANQYTLRADNTVIVCAGAELGNSERAKNARSLAFLLRFGRFRYYVGGDLESDQEDTLRGYLSAQGPNTAKLDAFKTSHHGSEFSTSNTFLNAMDPRAAIISCGHDNTHWHPKQRVINDLHRYDVQHYLTGEDLRNGSAILKSTSHVGCTSNDKGSTVTLRITETDAGLATPKFTIELDRPDAGVNISKSPSFKYSPSSLWVTTFT